MSRKPYPTDVSDAEWELIKHLIPRERKRGKRREVEMREIGRCTFLSAAYGLLVEDVAS